jgi:hypothetical protein
MRRTRWTAHEDATLKAMFATASFAEIGRRLRRNKATVRRRLRALGLHRDVRTLRQLQKDKLAISKQLYAPDPHALDPDEAPLACDRQANWWRTQRAADQKFVEQLRKAA